MKIHDTSAKLVYKVPNPFADGREVFFFSDPPHLIKTTRNCWSSSSRSLWVGTDITCNLNVYSGGMVCITVDLSLLQCNGKPILWSHLQALYKQDTEQGAGLRLLPKLKFEHVNLTSFSKMRVDLAAQVNSLPYIFSISYLSIYCGPYRF